MDAKLGMSALPELFSRSMEDLFGPDTALRLLRSLDTAPTTGIRLNAVKGVGTDGLLQDARPVRWCERGFILPERPAFALDVMWHQGRYYVQEPASMFAGFVIRHIVHAEDHSPLRVLDLCAAPGGKTTAVADELPSGSLLVANEYVTSRAEVLRENLQKWGNAATVVTRGDTARVCAAVEGHMDVVVADVPCSGEGMMRKEAEARRQWSHALVEDCAALQREIVANGAKALREGGWLIYSTCTFNDVENERNVAWICDSLGFEVVSLPVIASWGLVEIGAGYRFLPHITGSEGLYMCLLRKISTSRKTRVKEAKVKAVRPSDMPWIDAGEMRLCERNDAVVACHPQHMALMDAIERTKAMLPSPVAVKGKKGWEPTPAAAMSQLLCRNILPEVELDNRQALRYLARRTDGLPDADGQRGYVLATFGGLPVGWLKGVGSRFNNLYPHLWRLRINVE